MGNYYDGLTQQDIERFRPEQLKQLMDLDSVFANAVRRVRVENQNRSSHVNSVSRGKADVILRNLELNDTQFRAEVAREDRFEVYEKSLLAFIKTAGEEVGAYFTSTVGYENSKKMGHAAVETFSNLDVCATPGAWQIIFRQIKDQLQRDPEYLTYAERADFADQLYHRMSTDNLKKILIGRTPQLSGDEARDLERIGGAEAFRNFIGESK